MNINKKEYLVGTIIGILMVAVKDALITLAISAFFSICRWLTYLVGLSGNVTWKHFLGGWLVLFLVFFIAHVVHLIWVHFKGKHRQI